MTYPTPSQPHSEAPISVNFKIPEVPGSPMLTVRASSGNELNALTGDVARYGATVGQSLTEFRAGFLAGAGIQAEAPQAPPQAPNQAPPAPQGGYQQNAPQGANQAPPQTGGNAVPQCPHGYREYKSGVSKAGKPYKMWVCPETNRDLQCKPEWA